MRKIVILGAAAAALVALPASAQMDRGPGSGVTRTEAAERVREAFVRVDANRDGFISRAEGEQFGGARREQRRELRGERREQRFARLDANRDGAISRDEFLSPRGPRDGDRADRRTRRAERRADRVERRRAHGGGGMALRFGPAAFARMDADRDGRISLGEATARRLQRFDRADTDRDGRLSREERRALRAQRRGRSG